MCFALSLTLKDHIMPFEFKTLKEKIFKRRGRAISCKLRELHFPEKLYGT